ncbi:MAG TPA: hypothetical protein VFV64_15365, partial [Permianibacter sp.]|nr:hypothetical protein [Permianibacter sp.]
MPLQRRHAVAAVLYQVIENKLILHLQPRGIRYACSKNSQAFFREGMTGGTAMNRLRGGLAAMLMLLGGPTQA